MSQAVKVGIFATLALLLLGWFVLKIEDFNPFARGGRTVDALFDSVAGLDDGSAVRVAGVRVGRVDGIELVDRQAKVHLVLEEPVGLTEGAFAKIANLGLLGDKYIELMPGPLGAPPLPENATIPGVTPPGFDAAMAKLNEVADSIKGLTTPLAEGLTGRGEPTPLTRLIDNLEATSAEIRSLVAANRAQLDATIDNVASVSGTLARELPGLVQQIGRMVDQVEAVVAENRGDVRTSTANVAELTAEMRTVAHNLEEISGRINRGEGSLGKLVASDQAHDELVETLDAVQAGVTDLTDTLGRVKRINLDLDMQGFALIDRDESYGSFGISIVPSEDSNKLYRVALSETPTGSTREKTQTVTVINPDGSVETTRIDTLTEEDKAVVSALVGLRLRNDTRLWAGLVEDKFGVQVEYPLLDRRAWLDLKAFDFDRHDDRSPHLRLTGRWYLTDNLYLQGGYDDPLESDLDSFFLGGGIRWTDENLKYLLGSLPLGGL